MLSPDPSSTDMAIDARVPTPEPGPIATHPTASGAIGRPGGARLRLAPGLQAALLPALLAALLIPGGSALAEPSADTAGAKVRAKPSRIPAARAAGRAPQDEGQQATIREVGVEAQEGTFPAPRRSPSQAQTGESGAKPPQTVPKTGVTVGERGILLVNDDRSIKLRLTGRIHLDANGYRATQPFRTDGEDFLIRRGWFETYLNYRDTWEGGLQLDTSNRVQPVFDAVIAYRGFKPFIVTVGNVREPFSLQQMSSINQDTFVERASVDALTPARSVGLTVGANGERWTAAAGGFLGNINRGVESGGRAVAARVTYAPLLDKTDVLHFGASGSYRAFDANDRPTSIASLNVTDAIGAAFITTRPIAGASSLARVGVEAALQLGLVRLQTEYIENEVERDLLPFGVADRRAQRYNGGYVQAAIPINGPPRVYRIAPNYGTHFGIFGDMTLPDDKRLSRGGIGVFELAGRIAYLDLKDAGSSGGFERSRTVGVSWRPETNVKLMLNYTHFDVSRPITNGGSVQVDLTEMRLQYYW